MTSNGIPCLTQSRDKSEGQGVSMIPTGRPQRYVSIVQVDAGVNEMLADFLHTFLENQIKTN